MGEFIWPVRIYYEDTDGVGVVYYANYLRFFERARTEWLRSLGYEQDNLLQGSGIAFAVRRVEVDFFKPAHFNDLLDVSVVVAELTRVSARLTQETRRSSGEVLCRAVVRVVCIDVQRMRACPMPVAMYQRLNHDG